MVDAELGGSVIYEEYRGDLAAAASQVAAAREQWSAIKADVMAHKGAEVASKADEALAELTAALEAKDSKKLITTAADFLEIVDSMERLYV